MGNVKTFKLSEAQFKVLSKGLDLRGCGLNEDVFVSDLNNKKKKATLTYNKSNGKTYNKGNKTSLDMLKTDKMDDSSSDTYEVPLKGGIMSYNITSINGTEVMHYFKRIFNKQRTYMKFGQEEYLLELEDDEFRDFLNQFMTKVDRVVNFQIREFKSQNTDVDFSKVSIYPVPSSSNFNEEMAKRMNFNSICGLPVQTIDQSLLNKDLRNIQKDEDFIAKNQEYYDSPRSNYEKFPGTHNQQIDTELNKFISQSHIDEYINKANELVKKLLTQYNNRKNASIDGNSLYMKRLTNNYIEYCKTLDKITEVAMYKDAYSDTMKSRDFNKLAQTIKYTKGPSVGKRSDEIYDMIMQSPYRDELNGIGQREICYWRPIKFQIKALTNDVRMGLKNFYQPNSDVDIVQQELQKIQNSVLVIFDDNVSGGATLSDICYQLKNLGLKYLIPITFGKMRTSYNVGMFSINAPKNGFNFG